MREELPEALKRVLALLPGKPGVYLFKDGAQKIVYVGKAKRLNTRVKSYFGERAVAESRQARFAYLIDSVEWFVTVNESEAIILEDRLIKLHRPKYNIRLKDQKSYPYIKLSVAEKFPRLRICRRVENDKSLYFGPYPVMREAIAVTRAIQKYFPLRLSKMTLDGTKTYAPCLNFQLKRCLAPCDNRVTEERYREIVERVKLLLSGKYDLLRLKLREEMERKSAELRFEEAGKLRDQLIAVDKLLSAKKRYVTSRENHFDVLALKRLKGLAGVQVFFIRSGDLIGSDFLFFKNGEEYSTDDIFREAFAFLYLKQEGILTAEILISEKIEDAELMRSFFKEARGIDLIPVCPRSGERKRLVRMCSENAEENLRQKLQGLEAVDVLLEQTRLQLKLKALPARAECFDVSHTSGKDTVATMSVLLNGVPHPAAYKKFKVQSVSGNDDFASLRETLTRRCARGLSGDWPWPNLMIIDGGKGQIGIARKVLADLGEDCPDFDLIALAKGRSAKRRADSKAGIDFEYVVKPGQKNTIPLRKHSAALHFLRRIRDEAHRTAITYHRKVRGKKIRASALDNIPNIGPIKKKQLLSVFGSLIRIKNANEEEIAKVPSICARDAHAIVAHFKNADYQGMTSSSKKTEP